MKENENVVTIKRKSGGGERDNERQVGKGINEDVEKLESWCFR